MKTIALCASVVFYRHCIEIQEKLKDMGFKVILPTGAQQMVDDENFEAADAKSWYDNPDDFHIKADLMMAHFKNIENSDAILIVNDEKHGLKGYVGPNVAMEMGVAFYLNKPVYVLNPVDKEMPTYEEVMGVLPVLLDGELNKIEK